MSAIPAARLALFLLCPLVAWPGVGYDAVRLPFVCAVAVGLALGPRRRPGLVLASLAAFVVFQAVRLEHGGFSAVLCGAAGLAAYLAARSCPDRRPVGWTLIVLGLALGVGSAFGREGFEGNPNYSGAVAALILPPLAALVAGEGGRLRASAFAALAGAGFSLLASESRGGLLAALVGLGLVAALLAKRSGRRAAALPISVALLLLALPLVFRTSRYLSAERLDTASVRTEVWKGAGRLALDRPWWGTGVGAFAREFPPYRSPEEAAISYRDARPGEYREVEDAHSTWLHVLAESGFPGLILLLAAIGAAGAATVRRMRSPAADPLDAGLAGLFAAFVFAATFNSLHAHVSTWVLLWAAVGILEGPAAESREWWGSVHFCLPVLAVPLFFWGPVFQTEAALREAAGIADPEARLRRLESGSDYDWRVLEARGAAFLVVGRFGEAAVRFERVTLFRPHHGGARVNCAVARLREGRPHGEVRDLLLKAKTADPTYYAIDFNLGNLAALDGRWAEARERYRAAQSLHPRHAGSAYGEGAAWLADGKVEEALPALRRARELGMDVDVALKSDFPALSADPRLR